MKKIAVREIMSKNPLMLDPNTTVLKAVEEMANKNVSTIIVTEKNEPVGIVTEHDIVVKIVAKNIAPSKSLLKSIMSFPIIAVSEEDLLEDCAKLMVKKRIRKLPVIRNGQVIGILSENDIVKISPDLLLIANEWNSISKERYENEIKEHITGRCELCGRFSTSLEFYNGMFICQDCKETR
jgi:CBS domain-containing protein